MILQGRGKKNFILHLIEQGGLNPEWTLLHLLAEITEEQALEFCERHDLLRLLPTPLPSRSVEEAIDDLYKYKMSELDAWMDAEEEAV